MCTERSMTMVDDDGDVLITSYYWPFGLFITKISYQQRLFVLCPLFRVKTGRCFNTVVTFLFEEGSI